MISYKYCSLFIFSFFLCILSYTQASDCTYQISKTFISADAFKALKKAQKYLNIEFLKKEISNKEYLVILVGERHIQHQNTYDAGRELLKYFEFRGLEGANVDFSLASKIAYKLTTLIRNLHQKLSPSLKGSLIDSSSIDKTEQVLADQLLIRFIFENSLNMDILNFQKFFSNFKEEIKNQGLQNIDFEKVEKLVEEKIRVFNILNNNKNLTKEDIPNSLPNLITSLNLEEGHIPTFYEKLSPVMSLSFYGTLFLNFAIFVTQSFLSDPDLKLTLALDSLPIAAFLSYQTAAFALKNSNEKKWYRLLFPFHNDKDIAARDKTMSKNINKGLEEYKDQHSIMIVLVGAAHISGLKKLLEQNYSFLPTSLE